MIISNYIPLVYCFDEKYAPYAAVSMYSAWKNSSSQLKIYCVTNSKNEDCLTPIKLLIAKYCLNVIFINNDGEEFKNWKNIFHISQATYLRLLLPSLILEEKVLYLDCDTLILEDVSTLYKINLGNNLIGGVYDERGNKTSLLKRTKGDIYINAGVLIMNLAALREINFLDNCMSLYRTQEQNILWQDQCIINKILDGNKESLPEKWNLQLFAPEVLLQEWITIFKKSPSIIHFIGPVKPWMEWCNPFISTIWWGYANFIINDSKYDIKISEKKHVLYLLGSLERNGMNEMASLLKKKHHNIL
jgi:lipopolysaccharide biosynthesis glycosyltransferase